MIEANYYSENDSKGPQIKIAENGGFRIRTYSSVTIAKSPNHGRLIRSAPESDTDITKYDYHCTPDTDYMGEDKFQFDIRVSGKALRIYYRIAVFEETADPNRVGYCNWDKYHWKISADNSGKVPLGG